MIYQFQHQQMILNTFYTALKDRHPEIRAKAAESLGKLGDLTAVPSLLNALQDSDTQVRQNWNKLAASFHAAIKVGEHFAEENPWGKGAIAFLEGVSEDVG